MITEIPLRRSLAALVPLLTVLPLMPAATASAEAADPVLADASFVIKPDGKVQPSVRLLSASAGTTVDLRLHLKGVTDPFASFSKLPMGWGDLGGGAHFEPKTPLALPKGRTYMDLDIASPSGRHVVIPQAAFADAPSGRFGVTVDAVDSTGGGPTQVATPFGVRATVTHTGNISKIVARLYRAGTNEQVGTDVVPTKTSTAKDPGSSRTFFRASFDPSVGKYEVAVTIWDDQGDSVTSRTPPLDARRPQRLMDVRATPDTLDFDHRETIVTGRVTGADGTPVAGAPITVTSPGSSVNATGTTAVDGSFSVKVPPSDGALMVSANAHDDFTWTTTWLNLTVRRSPARVSLQFAPAASKAGAKTTLSGMLEGQSADGTWTVLPAKPVALSFIDDESGETRTLGTVTTDANGRYSLPATVPGPGTWQATSAGDTFLLGATTSQHADSMFGTRITNLTARPNPVEVGGHVTVKGLVTRIGSPVDRMFVNDGHVTLYSSPDGKRTVKLSEGRTDANGHFSLSAVAKADGHWWVAYNGHRDSTQNPSHDLPSTSARFSVDARYKTAISSFNASPEPVKKGHALTVTGHITKLVGKWQPGAGASLKIYFQPFGSFTWTAMGTAKANRNGWFTTTVKAWQDGTWAASYAGSPTYMSAWSKGDYVDVR